MGNKKKQKKYPWLRNLLTSTLGTAIGVGLTFTIDRCVDSHKLSFDFDTSNFPQSALERLKNNLEIKKEMARNDILKGFRHQNTKAEYVVSFDKSGNTMVWISEETTPAGNKQTTSLQLYRKPE